VTRLPDVELGRCTYRKARDGEWVVVGPVSVVQPGATVTVYRKDHTTRQETILRLGRAFRVRINGAELEVVYGYLAPREHTGRPA
jgi:hypothetical protein